MDVDKGSAFVLQGYEDPRYSPGKIMTCFKSRKSVTLTERQLRVLTLTCALA